MINNIDEAIKHCHEKAEENKKEADYLDAPYGMDTSARTDCLECAKDHEQLASWLEELKALREFVHKPCCENCIHWDDNFNCGSCYIKSKFEFNENLLKKENYNG